MPLASNTFLNQALDGSNTPTAVLGFAQMHTGSPGTTGANEMASCTRQAATWNSAASAAKTNSGALSFSNPGTVAATNFGTFSAVSAGTYGIGGALSSSVTAATITVAAGALSIGGS